MFARTWTLAGFLHNISGRGDLQPVTVAGVPLMLLRDHDGNVRCFHNDCRHRGAVLIDRPCQGKRVVRCPYHSWTYGLDGRLLARPHFFGADNTTGPPTT